MIQTQNLYPLPSPLCCFPPLQAIDAEKSKFDREMLLHGKELSEAEFEKMMRQHQAEILALEHNLDEEKEKQRKALEKKVKAGNRVLYTRIDLHTMRLIEFLQFWMKILYFGVVKEA